MIVTPFPVFKEHWDPNAVITMADDQGGTLDVKLLELLCFTRTRYKNKVADTRKRENDGLPKSMNAGCLSIWGERNQKDSTISLGVGRRGSMLRLARYTAVLFIGFIFRKADSFTFFNLF